MLSTASLQALAASPHNIVVDANTADVTTVGSLHTIQNANRVGGVPVNVFKHFVVGDLNTVDLIVPDDASKLVNIVKDSKAEIHGVLNSYQNGTLGGNVVFASSQGFLVGPSGVVNVGQLTVRTPTSGEIDELIAGTKTIDDSLAVSSTGLITINGKINARDGIDLQGAGVNVGSGGKLIAGNALKADYVATAAVNTGDYTAPTALVKDGGTIHIVAGGAPGSGEALVAGELLADGGITIEATSIEITSTGMLDARDQVATNSHGNVTLTASNTQKIGFGIALAESSVTLAGKVHADDVTVSAQSTAIASFYENPPVELTVMAAGPFTGAGFYLMAADAEATVNVEGTANVQASGNVKLGSESHALSQASQINTSGGDGSLSAIYNTSDATSTTRIKSGATVQSEGDLTVTAHNEAFIAASALDVIAADANKVVVAIAVGESDVDATAVIESGAVLGASSLVLAAENQNYYSVSASAMGLKDTEYGIAVAVGDFNTNATAEMGASLGSATDKTGDVSITALDRTVHQQVKSGVTVGSNTLFRSVGAKPIAGLAAMQNGVNNLINAKKPEGTEVPKDGDGKISFKGGLAFTMNLSDHEAYALLGNNQAGQAEAPSIHSTGNLLLASAIDLGTDNASIAGGNDNAAHGDDQGAWRTSAEAAVASPSSRTNGSNQTGSSEKSLAVALNFAINSGDAVAEIGNYVEISAANVGVLARQKVPISSSYDKWDSFSDLWSKFNGIGGIQNNILSSFANAGTSADNSATGGALNVVINDLGTKAWIGDNVKITTTGTADWSAGRVVAGNLKAPTLFATTIPFKTIDYSFDFISSVDVQAYNLNESVHLAGNLGTLGLLPNGNGTNEKGKSVGGSISFVQQTATAVAGIGAATLLVDGNVRIQAHTDERHFLITPSSGSGKGLGFNGVMAILNSESLTHASLSNQANVNTTGLDVLADHDFGNWAAAGAFNKSDESAMGLSVAINIAQGDTKAFIGDNSGEQAKVGFKNASQPAPDAPTTPAPDPRGIVANDIRVRARSAGTNGSLAVAGAVVTEPNNKPGIAERFENWWEKLGKKSADSHNDAVSGTGAASIGNATGDGKTDEGNTAAGGDAPVDPNKTGLAAAGSFTVSVNNLDAKALIDDAVISGKGAADVDVTVHALENVISASASGGAALAKLGADSPSNQNTIAGAIAYQISFNDALAHIRNSTISNAGDVKVQALHGGELTSVALALAVTSSDQNTQNSNNGALSISGAQIYDGTSARIDNSSITSNNDGDDSLEVSAYNNADIGVGGGSLYLGGKKGGGLAITFAEINDPSAMLAGVNPDSNNVLSTAHNEDVYSGSAVEAVISGVDGARSTLTNFDSLTVSASAVNRIGIGAAGGGYNGGVENSQGFAGSFAVGSIGADTRALISKTDIKGVQTLHVNASGDDDSELDTLLAGLGSSTLNSDYDFSGADAIDNTEVFTAEDGTGSSYNYSSAGKRIIAVAGVVQAGKSNLGISYAHADVKSDTSARMADVNINQGAASTADVAVNARDNSLLYSVAIGVGVSTGKYSGVGSVAVNRLNNRVVAEIGDWDGADSGSINAETVAVTATNDMDMVNVAGAVAVGTSGSTGKAGGLAVALNLVGTDEHSTKAHIANTALQASGDVLVKATSGASNDHNLLVGNAIAIGATGGSGLAFAGAIGVNNVDQLVEAALKDTGTNRSTDASATLGGTVTVQAYDFTDSVSTAWMGAGSGGGSAGGIAVATNRVDSDVKAAVLGDNVTVGSTTLKVQNLIVDAARDNWLLSISAGVAASPKQSALAGSVSSGIIDGDVSARIAEGARVKAWNNVAVNADALSVNLVGSGALGIGLGNGAGAVAVATALEYGNTSASIDNANVIAEGKGASITIDSGALANYGSLPDLSTSGQTEDESSDTDAKPVDRGALTTGFAALDLTKSTESADGLAVNATSRTKQQAITAGGAGAKSLAISVNAATNSSSNETTAEIRNSTINAGISNQSEADVLVRASAHEAGLAVSAGVAISGGNSGVGGFSTNSQKKAARATVDSSMVSADTVGIDANSSKVAQAVSAGVAAGAGTLGGAASVVITEQMGDTQAWLRGGTLTANSLKVSSDRRQEANVAAGAVGIGGKVGVGFGLAVNLIGGDSQALMGNDLDDPADTRTTRVNVGSLTVDAQRLENVNSHAFGAGISAGFGAAAMIDVSEFTGETRAGIFGKPVGVGYSTTVRGKDGIGDATSVVLNAQEILDARQFALGVGVGASVGIGAVANVVLGRTQVISEVVGSDIKADLLDIDATSQRQTDLTSIAGAAGKFSAAVSIGVALFGQGDTTADDGTNAEDEFDVSRDVANSVLQADTASFNTHLSNDDVAALKTGSGASVERTATPAASTNTDAGKSLKITGESLTAARISGGVTDVDTLNVNSRALLHNSQLLGAAQISAAGIAGVIGITRMYDMSIATVDSNLTADNVVVGATVENVSDEDAAGEAKSVVVGLGGVSVVVNYVDIRAENRVVAGVSSANGSDAGNLIVSAADTTELRLGDVDPGRPDSATDGSLNVNLGSAAIGVSYGYAKKASDVDAWLGETGKLVDGYDNMTVSANSSGMVKSTAFSLAGGIAAGIQGVVTDAHDNSHADATLYGTVGTGSGLLSLSAQVVPELYSSAYGVTVSGGYSMGGSFAYAMTDAEARATVADGVIFTGSGDVLVRSEVGDGSDADYQTAHAAAFAASGGLMLGVAGAEARASNNAQSVARVGNYVTIPNADFKVYARHTGVQIADADGYFVGAFAGGYQVGLAESFSSTRVEFGKDPNATLERTGDLILDANSQNENQAFTTAGGGGFVSGSAAEAVVEAGDHANGNYAAAVLVDDWFSGYRSVPIDAGNVVMRASNAVNFFAGTDSTTVSVVGGSGAVSDVEVDTNAKVVLGKNVSLSALDIDIDALNHARQIQTPWDSSYTTSVYGAGGGGANGTAALSRQNIKHLLAAVEVGENAVLKISDLAWMSQGYRNGITVDAGTEFLVVDKAVIEVGGALQGAGAESDVDVVTRNNVTLSDGVQLRNAWGKIGLGTYSRGSAAAGANVSVWAVAGVAGGIADVHIDVDNTLSLGNNIVIDASDQISLFAGRGSDGLYQNQLVADARSNIYNWTAIPIPAGNKAEGDIVLDNKVVFGDNFAIGSDGHIAIGAIEGALSARGTGVEKNPYLSLFSTENTFGSSNKAVTNVLAFNGNGSVIAGQYAYQTVSINQAGGITRQLYRYGSAEQQADKYSSRAELQVYIAELNAQIAVLEKWENTQTVTEVEGISEDGVTGSESTSTTSIGNNPHAEEINDLQAQVVLLSAIVGDLSPTENFAIQVADIRASAGNVSLTAGTITMAGGVIPTFTAKGNANITIDNLSDLHLMLANLEIANQTGGNVFVTGGANLGSAFIDEQSGSQSGIYVSHAPTGANFKSADVIVNGNLTNLLSSVNISVAEGDLIQQALIQANAVNLNVDNGSLLLNNPNLEQTYGRDPDALINFTEYQGWKPANATDFVQFYLNDKYSTEIIATEVTAFNNWFSGRAIRHTGDQNPYYTAANYGYNQINIYFNWGFSDSEEYNGADAVTFQLNTDDSSRGGEYWKFRPVLDYQSKLSQTATYEEVNTELLKRDPTRTSIVAEKIIINAKRLDINGDIVAGTDNSWSVNVGAGFDAKIQQYVKDAGLAAGDIINLAPGAPMNPQDVNLNYTKDLQIVNPNYQPNRFLPGFDPNQYRVNTYSFDIANTEGTSDIKLKYDVASGTLSVDEVPVSGGGYVAIRAAISSTGADGKIIVKDGLGQIAINNDSNTQLNIGTLSAGEDATGVIRITDLNKSSTVSQWYIHNPGNQISQYQTDAWAVSHLDPNSSVFRGNFGGTGTTASMRYNPQAGQLFYIREGATVGRSYTSPPDGYLSNYPTTVGDWVYKTVWNTEDSYYTSCAANPDACSGGVAAQYLKQTYEHKALTTRGYPHWFLSYTKYYGDGLTNTDPALTMATELEMDTHTYVKADHSILFQFNGVAEGNIDVDSRAPIQLTGNIYNPSGSSSITTDADFTASSASSITSGITHIQANGDIGSAGSSLSITTNELSLQSDNGSLAFNATAMGSALTIDKLSAKYDILGTVDKNIVAKDGNTLISANTIDLTSLSGSIGSLGTLGDPATYNFVNIASTGAVSLRAAKDIVVSQATGDLQVERIEANDNVVLRLGDGSLTNALGQQQKSEQELAYEASVWDSLNLLSGTAGERAVTAYENQFNSKYHTYWMLKQRLTDASDSGFAIDAVYLDAMKIRYGTTDVAQLTAKVKAEYQALDAWFVDQVAAPDRYANVADAVGQEQKGTLVGYDYGALFTSAYDDSFRLEIDAASNWYARMVEGSTWQQSQLDISISAAALSADASGQLTDRESNIVSSNIHLQASSGSVGKNLADVVFSVPRDNTATITNEQKSALLSAGPGDISTVLTDSAVTLTVKQVDPIKVDTSGALNVAARDSIFIESASSLTVGEIASANEDVRLIVDGAIAAQAGVNNVKAHDLYLANTQGDIGSASQAMNVQLSGALRQAGAAGDLYLRHSGGNLLVGSVGAGGMLSLSNDHDILGYDANHFLQGSGIALDADVNDLGSSANWLNLRVSGAGALNVNAANAWLDVRDTTLFTLGDVTVDQRFDLKSVGAVDLAGDLTATSLRLDLGGALSASGAPQVVVSDDLEISASAIQLAAAEISAGSARLEATAGSLSVGELATTNGDLALLAAGALSTSGVVDAQGELIADAQSISMNSGSSLQGRGGATLTAIDDMSLQALAFGGDLDVDSTQGRITLESLVNAQAIDMLAATGLDANSTVTGTSLLLDAGAGALSVVDLSATKGDLRLLAGGALSTSGIVDAQGELIADAQSISMDSGSSLQGRGGASLMAVDDMSLQALTFGGDLDVDSTQGRITLEGLVNAQVIDMLAATGLDANSAVTGASLLLNAGAGDLVVGDLSATKGDLSLLAGGALSTSGVVDAQGEVIADAQSISMNSGSSLQGRGGATLMAIDDISLQALTFGGDLDVDSTQGHITLDGSVNAQVIDMLAATGLDANSTVTGTSLLLNAGVGDLTARDVTNLTSTKDGITLRGSSIALASDSQLNSANDILATSNAGDIALGKVVADGRVTVNSAGELELNNAVTSTDDIDLDASAAVSIAAAAMITSGGRVDLDAASLAMGSGSLVQSDSDTDIRTAGSMAVAAIDSRAALTLRAGDDVLLGREIVAAQLITLDATDRVTLSDQASINAGASVAINANTLEMGAVSRIDAGGQMSITTQGDMQLAALQTAWDGTDALRLSSGGLIVGRQDAALHLRATGANAQGSISAVTGIGNPLVIDMPWLSAETLNGDINIVAERGLYSPFLRARNGNVQLKVSGNLTFGELIGNPYLWIDGAIDGDLVVMKQGKLVSRKGLNIRQIDLNGGGPLVLEASSIDVAVDSQGAANTYMSLSGFEGVSADQINVQVTNTGTLNVDGYRSNTGSLGVDGDLNLDKALVLTSLDITTGSLSLNLSNYDPRPLNVDGQLMSPGAAFWLDTLGFEVRTNALATRYRDPLVLFFYQPGLPQDLELLAYQRLSAEYHMQTQLSQIRPSGGGFNTPDYLKRMHYLSPVSLGPATVNTGEQGVNEDAELPPADEKLLEISSR
ncbi:leukotoxin LktA family filamentous adhesin [Halopseudomonas pelagia]|uniref:leukotoxin LktA family filamentous adhesin n=1 Tax=Halopseudomonas pelagia TaxID=553151 RepID=UPI0015820630|nr:leukotoxin LktA family filamentous adhesin [Halopseudomonas pelagia]